MSDWQGILNKPPETHNSDELLGWFTRMAQCLLNELTFVAAGRPHRFAEIEFYYHGEGHPDIFTHRDPIQQQYGRWYFHRTQGEYRSGSFKGLDLAFGEGTNFGGVLIRCIGTPDGNLIDGPSLCVDHLLKETGMDTVAALDKAIDGRRAWDGGNLLRLERAEPPRNQPLYSSGRVGLSLKRFKSSSTATRYILRPYRFLSEPNRIKKGKTYLVLALHAQGKSAAEISQLTGSPGRSVQKYIEDFEAGKSEADFGRYFGIDLSTGDLCRLHGTWYAQMKQPT